MIFFWLSNIFIIPPSCFNLFYEAMISIKEIKEHRIFIYFLLLKTNNFLRDYFPFSTFFILLIKKYLKDYSRENAIVVS